MDLSMLSEFITETEEHLEEMESSLLLLEDNSGDRDALNNVFRTAHSIKGNAEYLGVISIATLSHKLENLLEILRKNPSAVQTDIVGILIQVKDRMSVLVSELSNYQEERSDINDLTVLLDRYSGDGEIETPEESLSLDDDLFPDAEEGGNIFSGSDTGDKESYHYFEELKTLLYDITRGEVSNEGKKRILDILDHLMTLSGGLEEQKQILESLKQQAGTLSYPDDAGDMLAELNRLLDAVFSDGPNGSSSPNTNPDNTSGSGDDTGDTYEDETDEELFQIYMEHLKENLGKLRELAAELRGTDDHSPVLNKCFMTVESLKSSANYMDYRRIVTIYEKLSVDIEEYRDSLFLDEDETFSEFINKGLDDIIDMIISFFPQCRDELEKEVSHAKQPLVSDVADVLPEDYQEPVFEESAFSIPEDEILPDADNAVIETAGEDEAEKEDSVPVETNQGLFDELDSVFDIHPSESFSEGVDDHYHEPDLKFLEEELSSGVCSTRNAEKKESVSESEGQEKSDINVPEETLKEQAVSESLDTGQQHETESSETDEQDNSEVVEKAEPEAAFTERESAAPADVPESPVSTAMESNVVKKSVRVDARKIDSLMNQAGELVVSRAGFSQLYSEMLEFLHEMQMSSGMQLKDVKQFKALVFRLNESIISLSRVANELQDGVMKVRMLPISQLFNRYPRLVRDLTHGTDKQVRLDVKGEETELDKMVIEAIADPLVHIIRNAIDHGAETSTDRIRFGKPEVCTLKLEAYHESNHVVIEIEDDGSGIDHQSLRKTAADKGLLPPEEVARMNDKELMNLIMMPGFSTSATVTKTSGRGVGMDVVKKNIEKLNGTIEVESKKGTGTRIRIKIPLTLAIIKALLVKVGREIFTIPLATVEETLHINRSDLSFIEGVEVIRLRDSVLSLLRLSDMFNIRSSDEGSEKVYVVVVNTGMRQVGLVVDELLGQEETVIKPLVDYLQENSGFSGATILGDGSISLILDVYELINLSIGVKVMRRKVAGANEDFRYNVIERFADDGKKSGYTVH